MLRQPVAHVEGGAAHVLEAEADIRVEVEDDAVGLLDLVDARAPDVELQHAHLHRRR